MAEGLDQAGQLVSEVVPRRDLGNLRWNVIDAGELTVDLRIVGRTVAIEDRHSPDGLLHEVEQHVAEADIGVGVGPTPHRRQGMRGPGKKEVMDVRDAFRRQTRAVIHVFDRQPVRRDFRWKRKLGDASDTLAIIGVGLLFECLTIHVVSNQRRPERDVLPHVAGCRVHVGFEHALQLVLVQLGVAAGTWKLGPHLTGRSVQGLVDKHDLSGTLGTAKHLAPDRVVDPPCGLAVGVQGLIHPAELRLDLVEQRAAGLGERVEIERQAVVGGDEAGERARDRSGSCAEGPSFGLPKPSLVHSASNSFR